MEIMELLKAVIIGIVEGITEWLPVSSTGHMILAKEFIHFDLSQEFSNMFLVVIQLAAILAVVIVFFEKLNPFYGRKSVRQKRQTFQLWIKVIIGCIPAAAIGLPLNDWFEQFEIPQVVAATLIIYGIIFIVMEHFYKNKTFAVNNTARMTYKTAFLIGCFQCLALIPGTSRSGATILGAMLLSVSRPAAAEFSFFLSAPVMFGASLLRVVKYIMSGATMTPTEIQVLIVGCIVSFLVSLAAIKFLMGYVKKHSFSLFGYYRIIVGIAVIAYFVLGK
ncbi:MAG: undecaprenyl-diphosphate phosphatase [Lachnospiraceae bacterium]|nr:undecaprenyl-diphosphate phosphatase [Lachnospiraceae bacterium]